MTIKEFYDQIEENYSLDFDSHWGIQRNADGSKYINVPIMTRESLIDTIECETQDPWEDIEEDYTDEEERALFKILLDNVLADYDRAIKIRKDFMERLTNEPYEEEYTD